MADKIELIEYL